MIASIVFVFLAACSAPATHVEPHAEPPVATTPAPAGTSADQLSASAHAPVDATQLPQDVQEFILNQRMCRHFSRPADQGGNAAMAAVMCSKADAASWKALIRKYQDDETIGSVLLAERPSGSEIE
ncbi:MAG: hypothetical protein Q4G62_03755 [Pseudomonadota bacterium]|nr:hypothetical protein [Pseudomonadota bacterium]